MNFNNIGSAIKVGSTNTELKVGKTNIEEAPVEQNSPASKTYLTESSSQKVGVKDPYQ